MAWILSLLKYLGTTTEERNGKFTVALGPETEVLEAPRGKNIDAQMIVDLRRTLRQQDSHPTTKRRHPTNVAAITGTASGASPLNRRAHAPLRPKHF